MTLGRPRKTKNYPSVRYSNSDNGYNKVQAHTDLDMKENKKTTYLTTDIATL